MRIWQFDNRTGAVNEAVTLGKRRGTPAQAGLEEFQHPRIRVTPEARAAAAQAEKAPTWGYIDWRGIRVPTYAEMEAFMVAAGHRDSAAERLQAHPPQTGGVYESLLAWRQRNPE
jgi:hypothetical protein